MTDAQVSGEQPATAPSKPKRPVQPRKKKAAGAADAAPTTAPPATAGPPPLADTRPRPASSRPTNSRSASAKQVSRRAATGPGLGDWLSLGLIAVLVAAAAALYQWRGEARLGSPPPSYSQPAPGSR